MEWFKHATGSHEDPDISDAWDNFGDAGPVIFWTILEVFGAEYSHLKDGWLTLSISYFERKTRRKFRKTEKILEFFEKRERIYFRKTEQSISLTIPKFIKIASNWTVRPKDAPTEAPTEVTTEAPHAKEEEEKKNTPIVPKDVSRYTKEFLRFYAAYPNKKAKRAAYRAWDSSSGVRPDIDTLLAAISNQKRSADWLRDGGRFIPHPATWLRAGRWEDEVKKVSEDPFK